MGGFNWPRVAGWATVAGMLVIGVQNSKAIDAPNFTIKKSDVFFSLRGESAPDVLAQAPAAFESYQATKLAWHYRSSGVFTNQMKTKGVPFQCALPNSVFASRINAADPESDHVCRNYYGEPVPMPWIGTDGTERTISLT